MSIHRERDGVYRIRWREGGRNRSIRVHGSHELAKKIERKKMSARDENRHLDVRREVNFRMSALIARYQDEYARKKKSWNREKSILEGIRQDLGHLFVCEVDGTAVQGWYRGLTDERRLSAGTAVRHFNVMHHMMGKATVIWSKETGIEAGALPYLWCWRRINSVIRMHQTKLHFVVVSLGLLAQAALSQSVEWPSYNGELTATRFSPLTEITPGNVNNLRPACTYDTGETAVFQSGILMVQDVLYFTTYDTTYAIDASTCALKWKYSRPGPARGLGVNRGVAYLDGKVFRGTGDAHLFALDVETGQPAWEATLGHPADAESVPMAPLAWNGMVFAGNAGGDNFGVTGRVYAFSAADGHELWRFNVVPQSGRARATWKNVSSRNPPTGGATWTTYSLDPDAGVLWVSTGNVAPDFLLALHPGDSLYTTSVIALDARTGKMLRYVQPVKKDIHDWDMTAPPTLIRSNGGRQIAAAAGKDGLLHGIDRSGVASGGESSQKQLKILYSTPVTTRTNVTTPLNSNTETRFCPGTQGGTEWNGPAFHPTLNLLLVNSVDWCVSVKVADAATVTGKRGSAWPGSGDPEHPFGRNDPKEMWGGWLTAVDADTGKVRWKYKSPTPMLAAVTPTAGGLVFTGDLNGDVLALDASNGSVLWRHATGAALGGGIISYQSGGHQRVAAAAGLSAVNWPLPKINARVIVYSLP